MDLGVGIVCGRCEAFATLGTALCACGADLALASTGERISEVPPTTPESMPPKVSIKPEPIALAKPAPGPKPAAASKPEPSPKPSPKLEPSPRSPLTATAASPVASLPHTAERRVESRSAVQTSDPAPRSSRAGGSSPSVSGHVTPAKSSKGKSVEELMEQAKNFVCRSCSTAVPLGHKFCGRCGAGVPPEILQARTQYFGALQAPGKAKLILIRGEGVEGLSYQLNAEHHVVGTRGQLVFPDDPFVSPTHADFFYRDGNLAVKDEGSLNGVYLRVKGSIDVEPGDSFLAGEQVFRIDATPDAHDEPAPDGTYFYSSPKYLSPFRISQMLQGGCVGMTVCARGSTLQIGREGGDLNFPSDLYMSAAHCKIEDNAGQLTLTDMNSRNGSYIRVKGVRDLAHGDYVFIGRKLLRVEITAA